LKKKILKEKEENRKLSESVDNLKAEYSEAVNDVQEVQNQYEGLRKDLLECKERRDHIKNLIIQIRRQRERHQMKRVDLKKKLAQYGRLIRDDEVLLDIAQADYEPFEPPSTDVEIAQITENIQEIKHRMEELKNQTQSLQYDGDKSYDIKSWKERQKKYLEQTKKLKKSRSDISKEKIKLDELGKQRLEIFSEGFNRIRGYLKEAFRSLTDFGGSHLGDADLKLEDRHNPFTEGVRFMVRPARKGWCDISVLSGGEKTLASLALIFAIHKFTPAPIYVMDEIDAALDFRNTTIVGEYIKECVNSAQFIIVSLRPQLFEKASSLFGVYKIDNESFVQGMV